MALTIVDWIIIGVLLITGIGLSVFTYIDEEEIKYIVIIMVVTIIVIVGFVLFVNWYHTHTAKGIRSYKDFESNISNGLNREIIITAEDGREIFHYEGKVDVESNHEDNYIKFESEDGRRYMIYYGIQDTIKIIEKKE